MRRAFTRQGLFFILVFNEKPESTGELLVVITCFIWLENNSKNVYNKMHIFMHLISMWLNGFSCKLAKKRRWATWCAVGGQQSRDHKDMPYLHVQLHSSLDTFYVNIPYIYTSGILLVWTSSWYFGAPTKRNFTHNVGTSRNSRIGAKFCSHTPAIKPEFWRYHVGV